MKRILFVVLMALLATHQSFANKKDKDFVIKKENGYITFVVDKNRPAPQGLITTVAGKLQAAMILEENYDLIVKNAPASEYRDVNAVLVKSSFENDSLAPFYGSSTFFQMVIRAYDEHRPLVLTPDDVWLLISQGVAAHINRNAETLRGRVVNHEGKLNLLVEVPSNQALLGEDNVWIPNQTAADPFNWPAIFDGFVKQLQANTQGKLAHILCADFSTTTVDSRIASQVTLMNALQPFFTYEVFRASCGIPYITLKGTPEDWQKILDRVRMLSSYDLDWWTDRLCPVLEEFVKTAQGKPNQQFWRCMVTQIPIDKIRGRGCTMQTPTKFDGWFLTFFPYDRKGRTPASVTENHKMLADMLDVDFKYTVRDNENVVAQTPMKFMAGFAGVAQDGQTYELSPRIGWMVVAKIMK